MIQYDSLGNDCRTSISVFFVLKPVLVLGFDQVRIYCTGCFPQLVNNSTEPYRCLTEIQELRLLTIEDLAVIVAVGTSIRCRWSCDRICVVKCHVCDGKISEKWNLSGLPSFVFIFPCSFFICNNPLGSRISRAFTGSFIAIHESWDRKTIWIEYTNRFICNTVNNWWRGKELWAQATYHLFEPLSQLTKYWSIPQIFAGEEWSIQSEFRLQNWSAQTTIYEVK